MDSHGLWRLRNVIPHVAAVFIVGVAFGAAGAIWANHWPVGKAWTAQTAHVPPDAIYGVTPFEDGKKAVKSVCQVNRDGTVADHITVFDSDGQILGESESSSQQK